MSSANASVNDSIYLQRIANQKKSAYILGKLMLAVPSAIKYHQYVIVLKENI